MTTHGAGKLHDYANRFGGLLVDAFHYLALANLVVRYGSARFPSAPASGDRV